MSYDKPFGVARRVWCHIIAGVVSFTIVAPLTFMALDRVDPVTVHSTMFSGELAPGGTVKITWDATATRSCSGVVRRRIIDSDGHTFEYDEQTTVIRPEDELGRRRYSREFVLPKGIRPGPAIHSTVVRYYCNPLQVALDWPITGIRGRQQFIIQPSK
jgi:hypothetical protein